MSKRVLLGKWGSGSDDYGLKVSKVGEDVINSNGTAVNMEDLIFDSDNAVGSLGLYKVFTISNVPAVTEQTNKVLGGTYNQGGTPGSKVQTFGETLSFIPLAICQQTGGFHITAGASYSTSVLNGPSFGANAGSQDSQGFDDSGWYFVTTTSQITIFNYGPSTINVRAQLFYTPS
jgi:hypothetical protein|tara:strand:- start:295 stop:819 length:525 start_codon:yes stop_codon:yes gene_type:complete